MLANLSITAPTKTDVTASVMHVCFSAKLVPSQFFFVFFTFWVQFKWLIVKQEEQLVSLQAVSAMFVQMKMKTNFLYDT